MMVALQDKQAFNAFWAKWKKHLNTLVTGAGGKLLCPEASDLAFEQTKDGFEVKPKLPICLYSISQKATSSNHKLIVFIDGKFEFHKPEDGNAKLSSTHSNVAFFRQRANISPAQYDLVDAYHFDHFFEDPKTSAPHPVFHAQRNIRPDELFVKFRQALEGNRQNGEIADIDQKRKDELFGLKTFRVPTPQVDLFSLSVILAADHLIGQCKHDSSAYRNFKSFLSFLSHDDARVIRLNHRNPIRAEIVENIDTQRFVWQWYSRH